jgi:diguanylate cyclase (GGDEF)-like protein/PAS domain S-box-containing protein
MNQALLKYKLVLIPLALVMLLDLSLLAINYYITAQIQVSANNINIAGRQRMLSQKITKQAALIHNSSHHQVRSSAEMDELAKAVALFDETLRAFSEGGMATTASGEVIFIDKLTGENIKESLVDAQFIWRPLHKKLEYFLSSKTVTESSSNQIMASLAKSDEELLRLMNALTLSLEEGAKGETDFLRSIQTAIVFIILLCFSLAVIRLIRRENYYNNLMVKTTDIVIGVDVKTALTTFVSGSVVELLGFDQQHYLSKPASLFFLKGSKSTFSEILEAVDNTGELPTNRCEVRLLKRDGSTLVADIVMQVALSENGKNLEVTAAIRDISERKAAEVILTELAHKDELTGLPNRIVFYELAEHALNVAKRNKTRVAILYVDLDKFKPINDTYGHDVGDEVLRTAASRITACLRESDSVFRIGGDEFIVLLEGRVDEEGVTRLAENIIKSVSSTITINDYSCQVGASIGVAIYPDNGVNIDVLTQRADKAMYQVKKSGRNNLSFAE